MQQKSTSRARAFVGAVALSFVVCAPATGNQIHETFYCQYTDGGSCTKKYQVAHEYTEFYGTAYCGTNSSNSIFPDEAWCTSPNAAIACYSSGQNTCYCNKKQQKTEYEVKVHIQCGDEPPNKK